MALGLESITIPLGSHWALYSTYLTLYRDNPAIGLIHVVRKLLLFCFNGHYFCLGPMYKIFKSHVNYAISYRY